MGFACCPNETGIIVVKQTEQYVLLRFGKFVHVVQKGLHWVTPLISKGMRVSVQEQVLQVPNAMYITADNVVVQIDFTIFYKVVDPRAALLEVKAFEAATVNLAVANLRAVIGGSTLTVCLSERARIRDTLKTRLDEVTPEWGIHVNQLEINEIDPPPNVKGAMEQEKSAVSTKTATITKSEGDRQSNINKAEGDKKSAILTAEGESQRKIMLAQADKRSQILRAEGIAEALANTNKAAKDLDSKTMTLEYLKAVDAIARGPCQKYVVPTDLVEASKKFFK
eukprot:GFYU01001825.1.p1 GENE.GFYU01001825.1~~GFYU01001825.1.p1  ORF type:complete len:296 (-),score=102.33 GFYU01001825.1:250-1092(-)